MKNVEGIPEGWELVRVGTALGGEAILDMNGRAQILTPHASLSWKNYVIIKQIEPPKPTYVPWTLETCPVGAVCVSMTKQRGMVTLAGDEWCILGGADMRWGYKELLESGITCNGKPCGTKVQP